MPSRMKELGIDRLSVDEQVVLAHEILDHVENLAPPSIWTDDFKREIDRRLAAHAANPEDAVTLDEAEAIVRAELKRP